MSAKIYYDKDADLSTIQRSGVRWGGQKQA
jgi:hypothetical protein